MVQFGATTDRECHDKFKQIVTGTGIPHDISTTSPSNRQEHGAILFEEVTHCSVADQAKPRRGRPDFCKRDFRVERLWSTRPPYAVQLSFTRANAYERVWKAEDSSSRPLYLVCNAYQANADMPEVRPTWPVATLLACRQYMKILLSSVYY